MTIDLTHPPILDALGEGPDLTNDQQDLLRILLDPANDPTERAETFSDRLDELEGFFGDDLSEAATVADILNTHHDRRTDRTGEFVFEFTCSSDGQINGYNVMTAVASSGSWAMTSDDEKYLLTSRYQLTGLRAALKLAETLTDDYARIPRPDFGAALNRAAEDVANLHPVGEHIRDATNLMVNAALHYLDHPGASLRSAIAASYDEDPDDVESWVSDPCD